MGSNTFPCICNFKYFVHLNTYIILFMIIDAILSPHATLTPYPISFKVTMLGLTHELSTKRVQPARGWCATVGGGGGAVVQIVSTYPASPEARPPSFWGSQPCGPAAWLAERLLLAGDIESNPGPKPTLKTISHTRT